jgi:hypothetical protein
VDPSHWLPPAPTRRPVCELARSVAAHVRALVDSGEAHGLSL